MGRSRVGGLGSDEGDGNRVTLRFLRSGELLREEQDDADHDRMHAGGQSPAVPIGRTLYCAVDESAHFRTLPVCQAITTIMNAIIKIRLVYTGINVLEHVRLPDKTCPIA